MDRYVESELLCTHCNQYTMHRVMIGPEGITQFTCEGCGHTVRMRSKSDSAKRYTERVGATLQGVILGAGKICVEGLLTADDDALPLSAHALPAVIAFGRRLKDAGADYLLVPLDRVGKPGWIRPVVAELELPLVVDVGEEISQVGAVMTAGASTVAVTVNGAVTDQAVLEALRACVTLPVILRFGFSSHHPSQEQIEAVVDRLQSLVQALSKIPVGPVIASVSTPSVAAFGQFHRTVAQRCQVLHRLEQRMAGDDLSVDLTRASAAIGGLLAEQIGDVVAPQTAHHAVGSVEAAVELLSALGLNNRPDDPWDRRLAYVAYYSRKAMHRLISKPGRLRRERRPTATRLLWRVVTKPVRLGAEIIAAIRRMR